MRLAGCRRTVRKRKRTHARKNRTSLFPPAVIGPASMIPLSAAVVSDAFSAAAGFLSADSAAAVPSAAVFSAAAVYAAVSASHVFLCLRTDPEVFALFRPLLLLCPILPGRRQSIRAKTAGWKILKIRSKRSSRPCCCMTPMYDAVYPERAEVRRVQIFGIRTAADRATPRSE